MVCGDDKVSVSVNKFGINELAEFRVMETDNFTPNRNKRRKVCFVNGVIYQLAIRTRLHMSRISRASL